MSRVPDRQERWNAAGMIFALEDDNLTMLVQQLGRVDLQILDLERQTAEQARQTSGGTREVSLGLVLGPAYLWVLGAYELVRVMAERARRGRPFYKMLFPAIQDLKQRFERLRIPLAKLEAARKHPEDFPVAFPGFDWERKTVGWHVGPCCFVSRGELSDALLDALEAARGGTRRTSP